jgi:hypothetical protein
MVCSGVRHGALVATSGVRSGTVVAKPQNKSSSSHPSATNGPPGAELGGAAARADMTGALEKGCGDLVTHSPSLLSNRTLRRVLCRFGTYLHDGFGLLVKGTQLLAYKFGLDFHHVFQILRVTEFLYQSDSSRNIVRGIAE